MEEEYGEFDIILVVIFFYVGACTLFYMFCVM